MFRVAVLALALLVGCATIAPTQESAKSDRYVNDEDSKIYIVLHGKPCFNVATLNLIQNRVAQEYRTGWKAFDSRLGMNDGSWKSYAGCYRSIVEKQIIVVVFEDGDHIIVPESEISDTQQMPLEKGQSRN